MTSPIIEARHVGKKYSRDLVESRRYGVVDLLRELRTGDRSSPHELRTSEFWAVDDVSFTLERGTSMGVIGSNGAGKSTLLSMIAGIERPSQGEIRVNGRLGALLDPGGSLDPRLTGRENVEASVELWRSEGTALADVAERVVEFADLGDFIEAPVHAYSNGMRLRLGYSLVAMGSYDVILIDEALAVGDAAFRRKCAQHIRSFLDGGGSLVLVSHSMFAVEALCSTALVLDRGRPVFEGPSKEAIEHYYAIEGLTELGQESDAEPLEQLHESPVTIDEVVAVSLPPSEDGSTTVDVTVRYSARTSVARARWAYTVWTLDQNACIAGDIVDEDADMVQLEPGSGLLRCTIPDLPLQPGSYSLRAAILDADTKVPLDFTDHGTAAAIVTVAERTDHRVSAIEQLSGGPLARMEVEFGIG